MQDVTFNVQRSLYDPKPVRYPALKAKDEILAQGGEFFLMTVNGYKSPDGLFANIIKEHNVPIAILDQALNVLASTSIEGTHATVADTWAVVENSENNDEEVTHFVTFAFTPEEIEAKTALFIEGIKRFKTVLVGYLTMRENNRQWVKGAEIRV